MKKLISIIGPTAVGKTSLALELVAEIESNFQGFDIISADSRQVYQDIEIISGADVPQDGEWVNSPVQEFKFWQKDNLRIYGLNFIKADQEWSVAHFRRFARQIIVDSWKQNRLPIIVGGTGLYHQHLFNDSPILDIQPDLQLRTKLEELSVSQLQQKLQNLNPKKIEQMNNSDINNPRRLMRAIELSLTEKSSVTGKFTPLPSHQHLTIGLTDELSNIEAKIKTRVKQRFQQGAIAEVENLKFKIEDGQQVSRQLLSATGVREIQAYLDSQISEEECLAKWGLRELQYAKRQLTWWKKNPEVEWFNVGQPDWQEPIWRLTQELLYS